MTKRIKTNETVTNKEAALLESAASMEGIPVDQLLGHVAPAKRAAPQWRTATFCTAFTAFAALALAAVAVMRPSGTDPGLISNNQKLTHTIGRLTEEIRAMKEQEVSDAPRFGRVREKILNMSTEQLDAYGKQGNTLLSRACETGSVVIVKLLLDRGADVNKPCLAHRDGKIIRFDGGGRSPLMKAVRGRHWKVVNLLLDHPEIDPNYKSHFGETALGFLLKLIDEGIELSPEEQRLLERLQM